MLPQRSTWTRAAQPQSPRSRTVPRPDRLVRLHLLLVPLAVAAAIVFTAATARGEPAAASKQAHAPEQTQQTARAEPARDLTRLGYGCGWAQKRLADPSWRPFLSRVTRACHAIAQHAEPREITQQAYRERAFLAAIDRAARGLDALYLEMWRVRLADESTAVGTVALNDTGVFLTLQHERVFRLADRIALHYDSGSRTAWLQ
jgi:hypothetical protein